MWCFSDNHKISYNLRCGGVVKLPGTNAMTCGIHSLNFRGVILWNIIPKNIKFSETLPEFKRKLKIQLIPCNCAACHFQYYRICTYLNNCLVSSYIVIGVKLGFIIFTYQLSYGNYVLFQKKKILLLLPKVQNKVPTS